jgi:hypothetical protein
MERKRSRALKSGAALLVLLALSLGCLATGPSPDEPEAPPTAPAEPPTQETGHQPPPPSQAVRPEDLHYLGAFRLPDDGDRPLTFAYGGSGMAFYSGGDADGPDDGFPGSLFITGHDRLPYGELPDGSQVAEISIPTPLDSSRVEDLPYGDFVQGFQPVAEGHFTALEEIPRIGMVVLDTPATGPLIHLAWGQHLQPDQPLASHVWFSTDLSSPDVQGEWFIGDQSPYSVNGYMLEIPRAWADEYAERRYLGTGRFRDGGWSGMGPALFAYRPWVDDMGTPAPPGAHLEETVLLHYESSFNTDSIERCLVGYQHPDEWEGAAWVTTADGRSAVLFAGTKGTGAKYWYGYVNPAGSEYACVDVDVVGDMTTCRMADGSLCPEEDLRGCSGHSDFRGWWSARFDAQFMLYDPADLVRVATGEMEPWEPQPYAVIDIDEHLFLNPAGIEEPMLGTGDQRRFRVGDLAYDRENGLLYLLELFADEAKPVVHVWQVQ